MKPMITGRRLALLFAYIYLSSYVTRINLAAIIQEVVTDTGFSKSSLSVILVCLSVSYGVGQIINGRIGDKIKPQNLIFVGLCTATAVNLLFPFVSHSLVLMCILWTINGFAQAMMWPPMVKIMVSTMDGPTYNSSVVIVSMGSSLGTILVYLISPLIIGAFGWRAVLFASAGIGLTSAVLFGILKDRTYSDPLLPASAPPVPADGGSRFSMPRAAILPFLLIVLGIVFQGMLRDGVTSWMPTYLAENFDMGNNVSILCTVSLAVFSMLTFTLAGMLYRTYFKNEVACAATIFLIAVAACAVLLLFFDAGAVLAIVCMMLITGAMHGINLMLITHTPKRFRRYGNISTISGLVNSFTYVGAAIATYGVARVSEVFGWRVTVGIWLGIALLGTVSCLVAMPKWKRFIEEE